MNYKLLLILSALLCTACCPDVGSEAWCEKLKEKPKGEWTLDETGSYGKHCLLGCDLNLM